MKSHAAMSHASAPPVVQDVLRSPGRPLEPSVRGEMESRFGHDFSNVRVHTDSRAAESAHAANANAYTVGSNVVFGAGRYAPATHEGSRLLAHELAHTVQQRDATAEAPPAAPGSPLEIAAESAGRAAASGRAVTQPLGSSGFALARQSSGGLDQKLMESIEGWLAKNLRGPTQLPHEYADQMIVVLAWYRETHSMESFFTIISYSDEIYNLLAPWGFSGGLVSSRAPGMQRPHELLDSFDRAVAAWKTDDPATREKRRRKTARLGGSYIRFPTLAESEYKASQLVTGPLPGGGVYTGPQRGYVAAQRQAEADIALSQLDAIRHGGPISTLGRVIGATTAWATGRDVQRGGEIGAAFGSLGEAFLPTGGRGRRTATPPARGGGGGPSVPRPRPAIVEKAAPREPMPKPDPPTKRPSRGEAVPEPIEDVPTSRLARGPVEGGEQIGDFRIYGEKGLKGNTYERSIGGLYGPPKAERTTERGVGPLLRLFNHFTEEARAAGATRLRVTGWAIGNPNFLRMKGLVEKRGGTFRQIDEHTIEIEVPVTGRASE
ncbi:MAG TPA: DUF4157 domain-containing protein [Gaiellaceae bacterium]|nr:DUF4157 domain-containing protein [Gaiellaceae bacterium]